MFCFVYRINFDAILFLLCYYFVETNQETEIVSEKRTCNKEHIVYEEGKYGRLNLISRLSKEKQYEDANCAMFF